MASLNTVTLVGNCTRDPEGRRTPNGTSVCELGMAINRKWKDAQGQRKEDTTFVDVTVWGQAADFCRDYLHKGDQVLVMGRLTMDTWEDRTTNQKRSKLKVTAEQVQSLASRQDQPRDEAPRREAPPQRKPVPPPPAFPTDDKQDELDGLGGDDDESIEDIAF